MYSANEAVVNNRSGSTSSILTRTTKNSTKSAESIDNLLKLKDPTNANIMTVIGAFMSGVNTQYDNIAKSITQIQNDSKILCDKQEECEKKIVQLDKNVEGLSYELNKYQQRELQYDVIVSGLPKTEITAHQLVIRLNEIYNFGIEGVIHSFKTANKIDSTNHYLIMRFADSASKAKFFKNKIESGPLYVEQLIKNKIVPGDKLIYIADRLTPYNQTLLASLRKLKKNKQIYHCYYRHGSIFAIISKDDSKSLLVKTESDVTNLRVAANQPAVEEM